MKLIYTGSQLPKNAEVAEIRDEEVVMLVDVDRCIRCGTCQLACAMEYGEEGKLAEVRNLHVGEEGGKIQIFNLPGACRQCRTPCMYYDLHNFWIRCPDEKFSAKAKEPSCDLCSEKKRSGILAGLCDPMPHEDHIRRHHGRHAHHPSGQTISRLWRAIRPWPPRFPGRLIPETQGATGNG